MKAVSECMSGDEEDPSTQAGRKLDWEQFAATQDRKSQRLISLLAEGLAARRRTQQLREPLKAFFGEGLMADVCRSPQWYDDVRAVREQLACRCERSWHTH